MGISGKLISLKCGRTDIELLFTNGKITLTGSDKWFQTTYRDGCQKYFVLDSDKPGYSKPGHGFECSYEANIEVRTQGKRLLIFKNRISFQDAETGWKMDASLGLGKMYIGKCIAELKDFDKNAVKKAIKSILQKALGDIDRSKHKDELKKAQDLITSLIPD